MFVAFKLLKNNGEFILIKEYVTYSMKLRVDVRNHALDMTENCLFVRNKNKRTRTRFVLYNMKTMHVHLPREICSRCLLVSKYLQ
jgi:hypothetical protein